MNIKQKLIGLTMAALVAMGAAGPLPALAASSSDLQSVSATVSNMTAQVQAIAAARAADQLLFAQWLAQLHTMQAELAQGSPTPNDVVNMQAQVANMSAQATQIASRRMQENNLLATLPGLLQQIINWLAMQPR